MDNRTGTFTFKKASYVHSMTKSRTNFWKSVGIATLAFATVFTLLHLLVR